MGKRRWSWRWVWPGREINQSGLCEPRPMQKILTKSQSPKRVSLQLYAPFLPLNKMCINRNWLSGKYGDKVFKVTIKIARLDPNTAMTRIRNIRGGKQVEVVKKVVGEGRYGVQLCICLELWLIHNVPLCKQTRLCRQLLLLLLPRKGNQFQFSVSFVSFFYFFFCSSSPYIH